MCGGDQLNRGVRSQLRNQAIDQPRLDQRFVALNIDYETELPGSAGDFGRSIGPALMAGGCQGDFRAPTESGLGNSHIIRGNDYRIQRSSLNTSLPNATQQRFAGNQMQRLARKAGGSKPGRYNAESFAHLFATG